MDIRKSEVFLHHPKAQEVLKAERKYRNLSGLGLGTFVLGAVAVVTMGFIWGSLERAMFLPIPFMTVGLFCGLYFELRRAEVMRPLERGFAELASVMGLTEEGLCSSNAQNVERVGMHLILKWAYEIQIFDDSVEALKLVNATADLESRIGRHLSGDKAGMKKSLSNLHQALWEFRFTVSAYDWAFEMAKHKKHLSL